MFTGIIQDMATVVAAKPVDTGISLVFRPGTKEFCDDLCPGDSVAINGACHTVETRLAREFTVTAVGETIARTTMGRLVAGESVNLEKAATPTTALGGHIVQGHIDGVGRVVSFARRGEDRLLTVELPHPIARYMVEKASIGIDGVSLTVAAVPSPNRVTITIIPFTISHTTIGSYRPDRLVNVEVDIIAKYVNHYIDRLGPASQIPNPGAQS